MLAKVGPDGRALLTREVIDGVVVPPLFDEVVRITLRVGDVEALCTGVALGDNTVLTAGHCGCALASTYRIQYPRFGDPAFETQFYRPRTLARAPLTFFGYDCQRPDTPQPGRDLALLFLSPVKPEDRSGVTPPPVASMIVPYELAQAGKLESMLALGYGRRENGDFPRDLIAAFIGLRDPFCLNDRGDASGCAPFREFTLSSLVSETDPAADTCDGDSGGPVYFIHGKINDSGMAEYHRILVGITSRGLDGVPQFGPTDCGGGGVYTAVGHSDVLKWLAVNGVPLEVGDQARRYVERAFLPN
ncbi:trypsin-like serine protease [Rhizobium sp. CF080]|uniref:trypsin-like serine protease n=1 Tax=Rhizobium sp. (strain CF080) TaxID=1144310 RepID=UPI0012DD5C03|nr:trypsin-like serine protease [Rhizobium sp. CF080]